MENQPIQGPTKAAGIGHRAAFIIVGLLILGGAAYGIFAYLQPTENGNVNGVVANANAIDNSSTNGPSNLNSSENINVTSNTNSVNLNSQSNVNLDKPDWKLLNDGKFGFQLKYPPTWSIKLYTNGYNNQGPYVYAFTTNRQETERLPFISVRENWTVEQEVDRINAEDPPLTKITGRETVNINSLNATKLTYDSTIGLTLVKTIFAKGNILYMFDAQFGDADVNQVISTFALK
jgi:hypothetical protein